ncbi:glutaredoxin 3 [Uliginosibacterium sediminicola]|uniref:Glutaredoxin n=1 Tax=Uliginosibacterium sediminicola TaxID=2024550 RepID=A0ABU9YXS1_9RHOO
MQHVTMYSTNWCPFCLRAEQLLARKGVAQIDKINIEELPEARAQMMSLTGRRTVPQIFIGSHHVGGFDDLAQLERAGELDALLGSTPAQT